MKIRTLVFALVAGVALSGCASMPSWLGGKKADDTILPGQREEVLPSQKLPRGNTTASRQQGALSAPSSTDAAADCEPSNPNYPECLTPDSADVPEIDEESAAPQQ